MRSFLRFTLLAVALAAGASTILAQSPVINTNGVGMSSYSSPLVTNNFWSAYGTNLSSGSGSSAYLDYYYTYCSNLSSTTHAACASDPNGAFEVPASNFDQQYAGHDTGCSWTGCYWYESAGQINFFATEFPQELYEFNTFDGAVYVRRGSLYYSEYVTFYPYYYDPFE